MFPQIDLTITEVSEPSQSVGKVFKFDFNEQRYVFENGKPVEISVEEAVKQFVSWVLRTQIGKYKIYPKFGLNKDWIIGKKTLPQGFINSELKRSIEEQLVKHPLILSIMDFNHEREGDKLKVSFALVTTFNTIPVSEVM